MWLAYRLAAALLSPLWLLYLVLRQGGPGRVRERLGSHTARRDGPVWIQAVSVGEVRIALRLARALGRLGLPVALTSTTAAGLEVAAREGAPQIAPGAFPLDLPSCARRALRSLQPRALVLVETELWPSLFRSALESGVPVFIVNGRLSDRALRRTLRFRRLYARALESVWVGAQSEEHAARYLALGAIPNRVLVQGNLKYDLAPPQRFAEIRRELEGILPGGPLWVAGSVREGEEEAVAEAAEGVRSRVPDARLVLAPRHLKRAQAFAGAAKRRGLTVRFRSEAPGRDWDVLLMDTVGELWSAYDLASAAFVGGSLAPLGGQNVLEPAFLGKPVVFGDSTENFREEAERLVASGGGFRVHSGRALSEQISALLEDPDAARAAGLKAREVVLRHSGSVERTARWIADNLPGV